MGLMSFGFINIKMALWNVDDIIVEQEVWSFFSKYLTTNNPVNISEVKNIESNKIKTLDLFGRTSMDKLFIPLIDIYDNGSINKRIVID